MDGAGSRRYNREVLKPHSKAPRGLVALGSAAIMAVYGAGYARTRTTGSRFAETPAIRRPTPPAQVANTGSIRVVQAATPGGAGSRTADAARPAARPRSRAPRKSEATLAAVPAAPLALPPAAAETRRVSPVSVPVTEAALGEAAATPASDVAAAKPATDSAAPPAARSAWKDGTYYGWGSSRHGDIQAAIVIVDGRIAGASIAQCLTRYSCSWIAHLPAQVIARQSADVDFVTGATQSVDAFYYAVLDALSKAK